MDKTIKYMDLSMPKTQNIIAMILYEYFTPEELETFDFSILSDPNKIKKPHPINLFKEFKHSSFYMVNKFDDAPFPGKHYLYIEVHKYDNLKTNICCTDNMYNFKYLSIIFAEAANFSRYRNMNDATYNRRSIINNMTDKLTNYGIYVTDLEYIKNKIECKLYMTNRYLDKDLSFNCTLEDCSMNLISKYDDILLIEFKIDGRDPLKLYVDQTELGINEILLIIDKAIVAIRESKYLVD